MAAYAHLVSLMHLIEQIQQHPEPPVFLDPTQAKSLTVIVSFLQCFLEEFHSRGLSEEIHDLEGRIADVARAAEDVIESQILLVSGVKKRRWIPTSRLSTLSPDFYEGLHSVIKDMKFIEKKAMEFIEKEKTKRGIKDGQRSILLPLLGSSPIDKSTNTMVGFDEIAIRVMERLTGNQSKRDMIPLVGMGGSGKTTLARNVYEKPLIVQHFHVRSWATISQEWVAREVLIEILLSKGDPRSREQLGRESEEDLGQQLYQSLFGRKYLIVMDDMWSIEVWEKLKFFIPDNNNRSRVIITTRLSKLALELAGSRGLVNVDLLDEDVSWLLLCKKVFADKSCPLELEEIGRKIARNCRGLPLSIVTIGGLLAKSSMTRDYWEYVAENLSSLVNSEDEGRCLRILSLSYISLPVHLKPCFLYMGVFPEDEMISASHLIELWVSEGFLKPISTGKTLEVVGEDYLKDLVERNLVSVRQWSSTGKIKFCVVHDLLRDLCIREAKKEKFLFVVKTDALETLPGNEINNTTRRIAIHQGTLNEKDSPHHGIPYSAPFLRSCIIGFQYELKSISLRSARLLRILAGVRRDLSCELDDVVPPVNLRFISLNSMLEERIEHLSFICSASWNLQTLIVEAFWENVSLDIWKMPQLRHVKAYAIDLPDPTPGRLLVLENLQTLSRIDNFVCDDEVVERIPNVRKLSIWYDSDGRMSSTEYCLDNLRRLQNLESLKIRFYSAKGWRNWLDGLMVPYSLKKLTLCDIEIHWDDDTVSTTIGSLPHLEVLKLFDVAFIGNEWNPVEGQFCSLKFLELDFCDALKYWNADNTHFPCLENLRISGRHSLEEFPSGIGDIPTLRLIDMYTVRDSLALSAKRMLEEQEEEYGNATLVIQLTIYGEKQNELAKSLASNNFKIIQM